MLVKAVEVGQDNMDEFLVKMIAHIEQQCSDVEKECSILRQLLKPWPKKRRHHQENQPLVDSKLPDESQREENVLTSEEKVALEQVDRLLGKAQKALKIKEKVLASEKSQAVAESVQSEVNDVTGGRKNKTSVEEDKKISDSKNAEILKNEGKVSSRKGDISKREKVPSESKGVNTVRKNLVQSRFTTASSASSQMSSRTTTPRPSSTTSHSRPSSSKSRYTPAHMNAPFKTDVNTRVPHRKLNHAHKNHLNKPMHKKNSALTVQRQPSLNNALKKLPKIASTTGEESQVNLNQEDKVVEINNDNNNNDNDNNNEGELIDPNEKPVAQVAACTESVEINPCKPKHSERLEETHVASCSQDSVSENLGSRQAKEDSYFSLTDKSSKVKIPPKLAKLATENHALLERCSTVKLVKKVPDVDVAQKFIERLTAQNDVSEELWTRAKAMACLQSHQLMLKTLHSLDVDNLTETASFETVYRAKRLLEFILSTFAQTQDDADYLSKVQFRQTQKEEKSSTASSQHVDPAKTLFLNQGEQSPGTLNDRFVQNSLRCSGEWTSLQFEKHMCQLQSHILSLSHAEWWDILASDHEPSVLQMVHGLLTSNGEFFPAIIKNPYS